MTYDHTDAVAAIQARDCRFDSAFSSFDAFSDFRDTVLPFMETADVRWFWQQIMTPSQLQQTLEMVRDVMIDCAISEGLELGSDFSLGYQDGQPVLHIHAAREGLLMGMVPAARRSMVRAFIAPVA